MGYPDRAEVVGIRDRGGQMTSEEGKERARAPKMGIKEASRARSTAARASLARATSKRHARSTLFA